MLINNDGTDAVTGTFSGLAEGARVMIGGVSYVISYHGGTGNDVVLTDSPSPHAANDNYTAVENVTVTKTAATGVLANDSSPNGNPLTVYSVDNSTSLVGNTFTTSTGGRLTLNADGSLTYVPAHDFVGIDDQTFYVASDGVEQSNAATVQFIVGVAPLTVTGSSLSATQASALSGVTVATFTDPVTDRTAGSYSASINWGDGTPATGGTIVANGSGGWIVQGSHTYAAAGTFTTSVSVNDSQGASASGGASATVAPGINVAALAPIVLAGSTFQVALATFTEQTTSAGTYSTTINWGDGTSATATASGTTSSLPAANATNGAIIELQSGSTNGTVDATIVGRHVYATAGTYNITYSISDSQANAVTNGTLNTPVTVEAPLTPYVVPGAAGTYSTVTITGLPWSANYQSELGIFDVTTNSFVVGGNTPPGSGGGSGGSGANFAAYATAALSDPSDHVAFDEAQPANNPTAFTLPAGTLLDFYIVQDSSTAAYLAAPGTTPTYRFSNNHGGTAGSIVNGSGPAGSIPNVFFMNATGNADGYQHFVILPNGTFAVEDQYGGGDQDFNDVLFSVSAAQQADPPYFTTTAPTTPSVSATTDMPKTLTLDATIRDFHPRLPSSFQTNDTGPIGGVVGNTLGADGKPYIASLQQAQAANIDPNTFGEWYNDTPGVNLRTVVPITFTRQGNVYSYDASGTFFPINGRLFGNENGGVNGNFTLQANTSFSYAPGQYFSFAGDDDVWVYINDKLVIDLGGVHGSYSAQVYLDNLGLTPGQNYPMAIFSAERDIGGSDFAATTNIPFGLSDTYTYNSQAVDPNPAYTPNLNYSIVTAPAGATIDPSSGEVDWIPGGNGTFPFTIKATDPLGLSGTQSWSVNVTGVSTNHPPTVVSPAALPAANASVGRLYEAMVDKNFSDSDGDTLHYSAVGNWPAGMTVGDTGNIEWTPTATEINNGTPYQLQVQASDARGGTATLSFPISVGYFAAGAPYAVSATNNNNGTATFTWANSPESDVLGYNVYRTSSAGGAAVLLNQSGLVQRTINQLPSWTDTLPTPTATTTYSYYATAVSNTDGHLLESVPSTSFSVTVQGTGSGQPGVLQIVQAASASPTPVTGTTTTLSVLAKEGTDDTGLTYTWTAIDNPPAQPTFSDNGDNSAKNTTATFTQAGTYTFEVTVTDPSQQTVPSEVTVVVDQTATAITISPANVTLPLSTNTQSSTEQFSAIVTDQFGVTITTPTGLAWSCDSGSEDIDAQTGLYTAPESGNTDNVIASIGGIMSAPAEITFGNTGAIEIGAIQGVTPAEGDIIDLGGTGDEVFPKTSGDGNLTSLLVESPQGDANPYVWGVDYSAALNSNGDVDVHLATSGPYVVQTTYVNSAGVATTSLTELDFEAEQFDGFTTGEIGNPFRVKLPIDATTGYFIDSSTVSGGDNGALTTFRSYISPLLQADDGQYNTENTVTDAVSNINGFADGQPPDADSAPTLVIVGHGGPGVMGFGFGTNFAQHTGSFLDNAPAEANALSTFSNALLYQGIKEVIFIGCEVAQGQVGRQFLQQVSKLGKCTVVGFETDLQSTAHGIYMSGSPAGHSDVYANGKNEGGYINSGQG